MREITTEKKQIIGKYSKKPYVCSKCGTQKQIGTNHWGEVYPYCFKCHTVSGWKCLEPVPEGFTTPKPWKIVKLGDIAEVSEGQIKT